MQKGSDFIASVEGKERKYYGTEDYPSRIHDLTKQATAEERLNSFFTFVDPKTGKEYLADFIRKRKISIFFEVKRLKGKGSGLNRAYGDEEMQKFLSKSII